MSMAWWEDCWDKDEDGNTIWTPLFVTYELPPGPPVQWGEWEGVFKDGKQIGPVPGMGWLVGLGPPNEDD